jgi:hypothetical protein
MSFEPQPTSQLPDPAQRASAREFESLDPLRGHWHGAPFPPPLLGLPYQLVDKAAAHWLRSVGELIHSGEECLNTLFAPDLIHEACEHFKLPAQALIVVPYAGSYTLGSLHAGKAGASFSALFAAPDIIQISRLAHAALRLDEHT